MSHKLFRLALAGLEMTAGLFIFSQLIFLLGFELSAWHFFVMPILSLLILKGAMAFDERPLSWPSFVGSLLFFWTTLIILAYGTEGFWAWALCDRGLQTEILLALMDGANPLHGWGDGLSDWALAAPKAPATLQTLLYKFTGRYEMTHVWNLWMIGLLTMAAPYFFSRLRPRMSGAGLFLASLLLILNPVLIAQAFSSCTDAFFVAGIQILVMLGAVSLLDRGEESRGLLAISYISGFILLANSSAWGIFALLVLTASLVVYYLAFIRGKEGLITALALLLTVVAAYGFFGANPYMHNIAREGAMLGPFSLQALIDGAPVFLQDQNPLARFFSSLMAQPTSDLENAGLATALSFFAMADPLAYLHPDPRLRGFGILSPLIFFGFLALLALCFWPLKEKESQRPVFNFLLLQIFLMTLFTPGAWWARLIGFAWMLLVLVVMDSRGRGIFRRILANLMIILILVNGIHYAALAWPEQKDMSTRIEAYTERLAETPIPDDADAQMYNQDQASMPAWASLKRKGEEKYTKEAPLPRIEEFFKELFGDGKLWEIQKDLVKSSQEGGGA